MNEFTDNELQSIVTGIMTLHLRYGAETHSTSALAKVKHELNRRKEVSHEQD